MMHREKRTLKEIRRQTKRRIHRKRHKKQEMKEHIRISLPLKVVGDNCDEVIFDMEEFELILRSVRYVRLHVCPYICAYVYSLYVYVCCNGYRNGVQYDVSVGLDTLYVTKSHDPNEPMVTLRSAVLDNGYITTIRAKDWFSLSEKIERELYYKRIDFVVTLLDMHMYIRIPTFTHMYVYMLLMLSFIIYIHFVTRLYWMRRRDENDNQPAQTSHMGGTMTYTM